jgi:probable rRNA maturation factor
MVTVQIATGRAGVPHARSFARWANAAFAGGSARRSPEPAELTIRVVGAAESRKLNRTWRGKDKPTNVLSFDGAGTGNRENGRSRGMQSQARLRFPDFPSRHHLGDLAICAPVVAREAREQGKPPAAHWAHMVVHGVLHLLGYDHENDRDAARMEARETKILAQLGMPNPYV